MLIKNIKIYDIFIHFVVTYSLSFDYLDGYKLIEEDTQTFQVN